MTGNHGFAGPSPELTDPQMGLTAADVVATVAQQLETTGINATITPESFDAAESAAEVLLAALGAASAPRKDRDQ